MAASLSQATGALEATWRPEATQMVASRAASTLNSVGKECQYSSALSSCLQVQEIRHEIQAETS